jgi:hypothetical protein
VLRPEAFGQDLYLPPEPSARKLIKVPEVVYLYKLHGSIAWEIASHSFGDEVIQRSNPASVEGLALIFPTPHKEGESLGYPYSVMFRGFTEALARPDSALLTLGFGFRDEHINRLIAQALGNPAFQLMVVTPDLPTDAAATQPSPFLATLASLPDARITIIGGRKAGTFASFVSDSMPEVPDLEVEERIQATVQNLESASTSGDADGG